MKDEIKEILELLKEDLYIPQEDNRKYKLLDKGDDKLLLDYITNLQEENRKLKSSLKDRLKYSEELDEILDRNKKAIEYIEEHIKYECDDTINGMSFYSHHLYDFKKDDLLNILEGEDKDE